MKKSLYIFLCSLMGVMLFLILHRILIFIIVALYGNASGGAGNLSYAGFLALDYLTLFAVLLLGSWYGIWLGQYWYEKVYVEKAHGGLVSVLAGRFWRPRSSHHLKRAISQRAQHIESEIWQLEELAKSIPDQIRSPKPIKRRIVRKKTPAKK